jgi:hypothetical protein
LRESRKHKYFEEKKKYQYEIRKEKFNWWKGYSNVAASLSPWSQVYKLATGKVRTENIMTILRKPDGTVTSAILETMNIMLDRLITDDEEEENEHHKNIRKMLEETIHTSDDAVFTQRVIKQTMENFNSKRQRELTALQVEFSYEYFINSPD